jgi:hypothetical protein
MAETVAAVIQVLAGLFVTCVVSGLGLWLRFGRGPSNRSFLDRPVTPIASLRPGMRARVRGVVRPGSSPLHRSPITGRTSVCHLIYVVRGAGSRVTELLERARGEFYLDDGSGAYVRVVSHGARFVMVDDILSHPTNSAVHQAGRELGLLDDAQLAWIAGKLRRHATVRYVEETLVAPGQELSVAGTVRRDAGGLVFATAGRDLIAFIDPDEELVRLRETGETAVGWFIVALGVVVGGLIAAMALR